MGLTEAVPRGSAPLAAGPIAGRPMGAIMPGVWLLSAVLKDTLAMVCSAPGWRVQNNLHDAVQNARQPDIRCIWPRICAYWR